MAKNLISITSFIFIQLINQFSSQHQLHLLARRKHVISLKRISSCVRSENLPLLTLPLGVINGIDPVLNFHDDATVLGYVLAATRVTLGGFDGDGTFSQLALVRNIWDIYQGICNIPSWPGQLYIWKAC